MKHIKLYEGFVSNLDEFINNYIDKINDCILHISDCILHISDSYHTEIDYTNKNEFTVHFTIKENSDIDGLKDNYYSSIDRLKYDLDADVRKIHILYEHDGWSSLADGQTIGWVINKGKSMKSNELYKIILYITIN